MKVVKGQIEGLKAQLGVSSPDRASLHTLINISLVLEELFYFVVDVLYFYGFLAFVAFIIFIIMTSGPPNLTGSIRSVLDIYCLMIPWLTPRLKHFIDIPSYKII